MGCIVAVVTFKKKLIPYDGRNYKNGKQPDLSGVVVVFHKEEGHENDADEYVSADKLYIAHGSVSKNPPAKHKVQSLAQLRNAIRDGKMLYTSGGDKIRTVEPRSLIYVKDVELPAIMETKDVAIDGVEDGLKHAFEAKPQPDFNGAYVYAKISGEKNAKFFLKSEIGFYEAGKFVSLADAKITSFQELENKTMVTASLDSIDWIYTDATCSVGKVVAEEKIDMARGVKSTYTLSGDKPTFTDVPLSKSFSYHVFQKEGNKAKLKTNAFKLVNEGKGEFVRLRMQGQTLSSAVKIEDLYYVDDKGELTEKVGAEIFTSRDVQNLVGKRLGIKIGDVVHISEPLSAEDANLTYNSERTLQTTENKEDVLKDGTFIKLKDGRFVQENQAVRPYCYKYSSTAQNCDAFLIKYQNGSTVEYRIIANTEEAIKYSARFNPEDVVPLVLHKGDMASCDVIKTTNKGDKAEQCVLINDYELDANAKAVYARELSTEEKEERLFNAKRDFVEQYKGGNYEVDEVIVNGEFCEVDSKNERYQFSTTTITDDYSSEHWKYKFLKENPLIYENGKLTGGPHFDRKKANASVYSKLGEVTVTTLVNVCSGPGILLMLAVPPLFAAAAVTAAGVAIGTPIVNAVRAGLVNGRTTKYPDKLDFQRKECRKQSFEELKALEAQLRAETPEARREIAFLHKFSQLEHGLVSTLSESEYIAEFKMINGKGQVNESNAYLFTQYLEEIKGLEAKLKKLKRKAKRNPDLIPECEVLEAKLKEMKINYTSSGSFKPEDKHLQEDIAKMKRAKGFMMAKYIKRDELTEDELRILDSMVFNINTCEYKLTGKAQVAFDQQLFNIANRVAYACTVEYDEFGNAVISAKHSIKHKELTEEEKSYILQSAQERLGRELTEDEKEQELLVASAKISEDETAFLSRMDLDFEVGKFSVKDKVWLAKEMGVQPEEVDSIINGLLTRLTYTPVVNKDANGNIESIFAQYDIVPRELTEEEKNDIMLQATEKGQLTRAEELKVLKEAREKNGGRLSKEQKEEVLKQATAAKIENLAQHITETALLAAGKEVSAQEQVLLRYLNTQHQIARKLINNKGFYAALAKNGIQYSAAYASLLDKMEQFSNMQFGERSDGVEDGKLHIWTATSNGNKDEVGIVTTAMEEHQNQTDDLSVGTETEHQTDPVEIEQDNQEDVEENKEVTKSSARTLKPMLKGKTTYANLKLSETAVIKAGVGETFDVQEAKTTISSVKFTENNLARIEKILSELENGELDGENKKPLKDKIISFLQLNLNNLQLTIDAGEIDESIMGRVEAVLQRVNNLSIFTLNSSNDKVIVNSKNVIRKVVDGLAISKTVKTKYVDAAGTTRTKTDAMSMSAEIKAAGVEKYLALIDKLEANGDKVDAKLKRDIEKSVRGILKELKTSEDETDKAIYKQINKRFNKYKKLKAEAKKAEKPSSQELEVETAPANQPETVVEPTPVEPTEKQDDSVEQTQTEQTTAKRGRKKKPTAEELEAENKDKYGLDYEETLFEW